MFLKEGVDRSLLCTLCKICRNAIYLHAGNTKPIELKSALASRDRHWMKLIFTSKVLPPFFAEHKRPCNPLII